MWSWTAPVVAQTLRDRRGGASVEARGDFNADGKNDVLAKHKRLVSACAETDHSRRRVCDRRWRSSMHARLHGDGNHDVLLRRPTSSSCGGARTDRESERDHPRESTTSSTRADFNGDGRDDRFSNSDGSTTSAVNGTRFVARQISRRRRLGHS